MSSKHRFNATLFAGVTLACLTLAPAQAQQFSALRAGDTLVNFDAATPGSQRGSVAVTGLGAGQTLVGIDVRPATNRVLYGLSNTGQLYAINRLTGAAALVTTAPAPVLSGTAFGFDFNPTVDRIRVVSNTGQNLRLNPDTGAVAATDGPLAYAAGDVNAGAAPGVTAAGYTNSVAGATTTVLYVLDTSRGVLAAQNPPNNGTLNTVGGLGVASNASTGFDILPSGAAYAVLTNPATGVSSLYTVNLTTGAATLVGALEGATTYNGLALAATPFGQIGLTPAQRSVGRALDNIAGAPSAGLVGLFAALDSAPAATASGLGQLTPQSYANLTEVGRIAADSQARAVTNHLDSLRRGLAQGRDVAGGVFIDGGLTVGRYDAGIDRTATRADVGNFTMGANAVTGNLVVGGSLSYGDARVRLDRQGGSAKLESWGGGAFGSWGMGHGYVELQAMASKGDAKLRRNVVIGGVSNNHTANPDARMLGASGTIGARYDVTGFSFEPFVGVQYVESKIAGFAETGGITALSVRTWSQNSLQSKIGAKMSGEYMARGATVRPELRLAYVHEFKDDLTVIDSRLYNTGGAVFRTKVAPLDVKDTAQWGLGLSVIGERGAVFRIDYDARSGGDYDQQAASLQVKFPF